MATQECILSNPVIQKIRELVEAKVALLKVAEPSEPLLQTIISGVTSELWEQ